MNVLLLSADPWEMTDENTGEFRKGTTLFYLNDYRDSAGKSLGYKPTKVSASSDVFKDLKASQSRLPAFATLSFSTVPGAGGKASVVIDSVEVTEEKELFE
ncbi:hypothetical protein [Shewanella sp.]|uniref:hypothetical protein n=1 Tax=Shewanella sp. TaxID=50422 RepID=UPI001DCB65EB|nr:hypothetical protein [Shewanella sp.]MCJ8305155.1 hypothetical protein [Shewanella sp.]NQY27811.1 hypothetical protein [Piscirickettsiaceae bacterium]NQZ33975.1 hypothetical protein [Oceanospirillaceae bacterium]